MGFYDLLVLLVEGKFEGLELWSERVRTHHATFFYIYHNNIFKQSAS